MHHEHAGTAFGHDADKVAHEIVRASLVDTDAVFDRDWH